MEHLQHFGLRLDPFQIEPDLRFYYDSPLHSDAQRRVERGLRQSKGLSILTGESGTGKSLLARRLFSGLEEELFEAALMVMLPGAADAGSVISRFAKHLEIEDPSADSSRVIGQVYEQLAVVREDGRHSVLILDDANLLGPAALAEVGALLSFEYEDRRLVSILLVGSPALDVDVASDPSLGQRVDVRVGLLPLDFDNATVYLANRIRVAGGEPEIISAEAVQALFKYSCGRPRLINTLADNALFEAYLAGRRQIDAADVERAAGDLGIEMDPGSSCSESGAPLAPALTSTTSGLAEAPPLSWDESPTEDPGTSPAATPMAIPTQLPDPSARLDTAESNIGEAKPEVGPEVADEEMDLESLLETVSPEPMTFGDELPMAELDLDVEVDGGAGELESASPPSPPSPAEQTQLLLDDDPIEFEVDDSGVLASEDPAAIELGAPLRAADDFGLPDDSRALDIESADDASGVAPSSVADATRLMLPEDDELLITADDGDEIEALFGQLLDD